MPPSKRTSSVLSGNTTNGDHDDLPEEANRVTKRDDALAAAEEAEAEAAEAEAQAAAARARARAIRLRREAAAAEEAEAPAAAATVGAPVATTTTTAAATPDVEDSSTELDEPTAEAAAASDDAVEDYPDDAPKRKRLRGLLRRAVKPLAAAAVVVASIGLLGLTTTIFLQHRNVDAQRQLTAEYTAAARQGAITLMSLNFNTAKADVQRIIDNTTGDFHQNFQDQADDFIKVAESSKVVTEATVTGVGIQKMTKDTATALVTVTTRVSNMASDKQDPRAWRLSVDLARDGGQIKLAKVEFVP